MIITNSSLTLASLGLNVQVTNRLYPTKGYSIKVQEEVMFEVTESAINNLKSYLEQNNIDSAVRIALMQGG